MPEIHFFFSSCCWCILLTHWNDKMVNNAFYCPISTLYMETFVHQAINIWWLWDRHNFTIQKHKNNSFTTIDTKGDKQCVGNKCLRLWCFLLFGVMEHQNTSAFFINKHKATSFTELCNAWTLVFSHSSLQHHLTLSGVVCYCDIVLKYINNTKKRSWN